MDDALRAYGTGHADGLAGALDDDRAADPDTGADYRTGLADGQLAKFETDLVAAVRRALGGPASGGPASGGPASGEPGSGELGGESL
jgi:hypothetical protein